ncbi:MAG TPA: hypothetical protein VGR90_07220 [Acidimicrobiales bacterium]|nr:hypothetical protein [Acidimicrobiales bacterium]
MVGLTENASGQTRRIQGRFFVSTSDNPHAAVDALRKLEQAKAEHDIV